MRRRRGAAFAVAFSEVLRRVAEDYASFVLGAGRLQPDDDPTSFGRRHAAAKTCLSHLNELLTMIGEDAGLESVRDGFALLHEAQAALGPPPLMIEGDLGHDDDPGDDDGSPPGRAGGPAGAA